MRTVRGNGVAAAASGNSPVRGVFLVVAVATAVAAPWMVGSQSVGAQWVLLWGALGTVVAGTAVHLFARGSREESGSRWVLGASLFCGALLMAELGFQVMNPSHAVISDGALWRLVPLAPDAGLPQSIAGRFSEGGDYIPFKNAARYLLIFGAVWCYAAGLALGLVERADARLWLVCMGVNGIVMAVVCLAHRAMREELTLWRYQTTFDFTHSPIFFYKNHNGAYLAASLAIVLGLAASRRMGAMRGGWEVGALTLWLATVSVNSRAATAIATSWIALYVVCRVRAAIAERREVAKGAAAWLPGALPVFAMLLVAGVVFVKVGAMGALSRFGEAWRAPMDFVQGGWMRAMQREVALEMWRERPVWGWGGGSYVYLFNTYHVRVPELAAQVYREQPQLNRFYNPTANCDWVEFLVEYGAVGVGFMVAALAFPLGAWFRWRGWREPLPLFLMCGVAGLVLHAYLDYILRNPALLILGTGTLFAAVRMTPRAMKLKTCPAKDTCNLE